MLILVHPTPHTSYSTLAWWGWKGSWQKCIKSTQTSLWSICVKEPQQLLKMQILGVTLTLLLLLQYDLTCEAADPSYLIAVTSQAVSGTTETLCAHINDPDDTVSLLVTLSLEDNDLTILRERNIKRDFYSCETFQVPVVLTETVATVYVKIEGPTTSLRNSTKILIKPSANLIFIQTDKPIYKPGETVKFRIVSLTSSLLIRNQKFRTVELLDPRLNRIGQWLNRTTNSGILDLFRSMTAHAAEGSYIINAWDENNQQTSQSFEIKQYVLPKFEVNANLPPFLTAEDKRFTLNICAKYTYGKAVQGSVTVEVCGIGYIIYLYVPIRPMPESTPDTCKTYSLMIDETGCASEVIKISDYGMNPYAYFQVTYKVEEEGTGMTVEGSSSVTYTSEVITVSFGEAPGSYKPGLPCEGKILVSDRQSKPMKDQIVYLTARYGPQIVNLTLTTDINGTAYFSFDTTEWSGAQVSLEARHKDDKSPSRPSPIYYQAGFLWLKPFYSKSKSFLTLLQTPMMLSCASDANVEAKYIIQGSALKRGQKKLDIFYMVYSKGSMTQNGRISIKVRSREENKGTVSFTLQKTQTLSPFAQVVVYTILPNGETVADSFNFPIEKCLPNKVSLKFSSSTAMPKEITTLSLTAHPGSLCSVRSIDQSVLLLKPEAELNAEFVFGMLPVQMVVGYPYQVMDPNEYGCIPVDVVPINLAARGRRSILPFPSERRSILPFPSDGSNDAYSAFRGIGVRITTNSDVKEPIYCNVENTFSLHEAGEREPAMNTLSRPAGKPVQNTIRKSFPETWIWDLVPVGQSGSVSFNKRVPDTITKWATGAFCTSAVGFGVAPSTSLTAFQPFFVSLTLPYSIIRGEELTIKATVFNYLSSCIMVKVTLADSDQFSVLPCNDCDYTQCICDEESKTFQWTIKPSVLGQVNVTVRAETIQNNRRCGNGIVTLPEGRRIDTVVQSFLVEAEGVQQTITHNELICLTGNQVNTNVPLNLPEVVVQDSAKSFVTVLGDLMGYALKNIANLLAMPYGCGEQNMLNFAPNIYILQYLESSAQLTPEILARAKTFLETGYQTELNYKHSDGSYSAFGNSDPSGHTWLTAYVMKIFSGAQKYVFVDQANIDQAKNWLGMQQQENGCFKTVGFLHHNDMKGGVSDDVTLTAYIVAALLEMGVDKSESMVVRGLKCLRDASSNVENTYFIALASYTFTLAKDHKMRQKLVSILDSRAIKQGTGLYWTQANNGLTGSLEVEMSSYVLLALLSGPTLPSFGLNYSASIVQWLSQKQNAYGGFSSTQDTVVALQALAKYSAATYSSTGSVVVSVTSPSRQKYTFNINQNNRLLYQQAQLQPPNGTFALTAQGRGCVFVQFALHYNILPSASSSAFSITINPTCNGKKYIAVTLPFTVRYNGPRDKTNMVIIDVKLLSGFVLDYFSLQALQQDPTVKLVEQNDGHVIIYLYGMKKGEEKSFTLSLQQNVVVKNLKPAVVTVFDYYKTSEGAVRQYSSPCA